MKNLSQMSVILMKNLSHFGHLRLAGMDIEKKKNRPTFLVISDATDIHFVSTGHHNCSRPEPGESFFRGTHLVRDDLQLSRFVGQGQGSGLRFWVVLTLTITITQTYLQPSPKPNPNPNSDPNPKLSLAISPH